MNFSNFKNSDFYKLGQLRYDIINHEFKTMGLAFYDTLPLTHIDSKLEYVLDEKYLRPVSLKQTITLLHLRRALENECNFVPMEFRLAIAKQWQEVTSMLDKLEKKPIASFLMIQAPGMERMNHKHDCPQTFTVCFSFDEDTVESQDHFVLDSTRIAEFPKDNKFYFTFVNDPYHAGPSSKWRFFYFHDFDGYLDIPTDFPGFTYWDRFEGSRSFESK